MENNKNLVEIQKDFETRLSVLESDLKKSQDELLRTKEELSRTKSQLLTLSSNISSQRFTIIHVGLWFSKFILENRPWAPSSLTPFHQNITTRETCSIYQLGCSQCILQVIKTRLLSIFKRLRLSIKLNIHYHSHSLPFPPEYSLLSLQASTQSTTTPFRGSTMAEAMFR